MALEQPSSAKTSSILEAHLHSSHCTTTVHIYPLTCRLKIIDPEAIHNYHFTVTKPRSAWSQNRRNVRGCVYPGTV